MPRLTRSIGVFLILGALLSCSGPPAVEGNPELRARTFDAMVAQLEDRSAEFEASGVPRGTLATRHRQAAIAAERFDEFYRVLNETAIELDDPHIQLEPPEAVASRLVMPWLYLVAAVGDHPWVQFGADANCPVDPRTRWCELLAVGGVTTRRLSCLAGLLSGPPGTPRSLRCRTVAGEEFEVVRECEMPLQFGRPYPLRAPLAGEISVNLSPNSSREATLTSRAIGERGEVVVLRIGSFDSFELGLSDEAHCRLIAELCESARGAECVILDLRHNLGGEVLPALRLIFAFDPQRGEDLPLRIARPVRRDSRQGIETRGVNLERVRAGESLPPPILATLIVLVDDFSASGAEWAAATLRCRAGATVVGSRTLGAEWAACVKALPDGSTLSVGLGGGLDEPCGGFQGVGIEPDIVVPYPHRMATEWDPGVARRAFDDAILAAGLRAAGLEPSKWMVRP